MVCSLGSKRFQCELIEKVETRAKKEKNDEGQCRKGNIPSPFFPNLSNFLNKLEQKRLQRRQSDLSHLLLSCFFYVLQEANQLTVLRRGLWGFSSLSKKTRMFNNLQMWNKGSTFSSLISRPRVLMQQEKDRGESLRVFPVNLSISMQSNFIDIRAFA